MVLHFIIILLTAIYLVQIIRFYIGLSRLKPGTNNHPFSISIIVPARNEERQIASCLSSLRAQQYPPDKFEIIVVNDNSSDSTAAIVQDFSKKYPQIKLLNLIRDDAILSPKKRAITAGIAASQNELIFTTDADCVAPPLWLQTMASYFESGVGLVTGIVVVKKEEERSTFHKIQSLEFLSLVLAGAGSIGTDVPIIGNGANLAYRCSLFEEVQGFHGIDNIKSGDDDLFIQKVAKLTSWKIKCAADKAAIISTSPVTDVRSLFNQRIRWASKGIHYHNQLFVGYLIAVYLFYALIFFLLPLSLLNFRQYPSPLLAFIVKMGVDFLLVNRGTTIVGRRDLLTYFLPAEILQIPYILIVGMAGLWGSVSWKGRK